MKKFEWMSVESEAELRRRYSFEKAKALILRDLDLEGVVYFRSYKTLYSFVSSLQKNFPSSDDEFFISTKHRLAFSLLVHNENLDSEIGISKPLFFDRERARKWRDGLMRKFHPDLSEFPRSQEICNKITKIYKRLIGDV